MTREERDEVLKILAAQLETIGICEMCARTTCDLADEVRRGGMPSKDDLQKTVEEAERVLTQLVEMRSEAERLVRQLS